MSVNNLQTPSQVTIPEGATSVVFSGKTTDVVYAPTGTLLSGFYALKATSLDGKGIGFNFVSATDNENLVIPDKGTGYFQLSTSISDAKFKAMGNVPTSSAMSLGKPVTPTQALYTLSYGNGVYIGGGAGASDNNYIYVATSTYGSWTPKYTGVGYATGSDHDGTKFVVAGSEGIATSTDGNTWTRNSMGAGIVTWNDVKYMNSNWVATGTRGSIATSTDGITWTGRSGVAGNSQLRFMLHNGSFFISGQNAGAVVISTTGRTWTRTSTTFNNVVFTMSYTGSAYLAAGASGGLATSTDALTWTSRTSGFGTTNINASTYGNSLYVIGGVSGLLSTSTDGITWTARTSTFGTSDINGLAYGASTYVAVGVGGTLASSTDGITWTSRTSQFGTSSISGVNFINNKFVAVGAGSRLSHSTDGITWTGVTISGGATTYYTTAYFNGLYIAAGASGNRYSSTDLVTWTVATDSDTAYTATIMGLASNGTYLIAGGANGYISQTTNGTTWSSYWVSPTGSATTAYNAAAYYNGRYLVAMNAAVNAYSTDLVTWTRNTSAYSTSDLISDGTRFIAVTGTTAVGIASSTDGVTWTPLAATELTGNCISYNSAAPSNKYLLGLSTTSAAAIKVSTDAITWTAGATPATTAQVQKIIRTAVTTGHGYYMAADFQLGYQLLATTSSGSTWVNYLNSTTIVGATANTSYIVAPATGYLGYASTTTPGSWTYLAMPSTTAVPTGIVYGKSTYAVSTNIAVYTTTNLSTWTTAIATPQADIAYDSTTGYFVSAEAANVIRWSTDGVTWTSVDLNFTDTVANTQSVAANEGWIAAGTNGGEIAISGSMRLNRQVHYYYATASNNIAGIAIGNGNLVAIDNNGNIAHCKLSSVYNNGTAGTALLQQSPFVTVPCVWSGASFIGVSVAYNNGTFAAITQTEMATSTDGYTWTLASISLPSYLGNFTKITPYGDSQFFVTGTGYVAYTNSGTRDSMYTLYKVEPSTLSGTLPV